MPVFNSLYGIGIKDSKPVKVCQWIECPNAQIGYEERKMKMCAKCNAVRYCSKSCQRLDWSEHKLYCHIPPIMDIGGWMERHRSLFRWALIEGLRLRSEPSNIFQYVLQVELTCMDRLMKGITPSPFFVESMRLKKLTDVGFMTVGPDPYERSQKIIDAGGLGQGIVVFELSERRPGGYVMFQLQYHNIHEKPSGEESPSRTGWEKIARGVVNGDIPIALLSRRIEGPPNAASST
ncbi:hypothetical protein GGX14DRAFT_461648 [Mycena pura]|uniref:MYND-type domain-containing protein n=1 Tax=Mycena pura TaxID=153505 RepID=A0AAD6Y690_9AGAR|nr:hypothetical protein GGX14DRAFT_461648 [Mycena pura]